jgi:hypothetical protein
LFAGNKALQITDLCLRAVHGYTFTDTSEGGARLVWHFSRIRKGEGERKAVGTVKFAFNMWPLWTQKQFVIRIFCYMIKEFIHGITNNHGRYREDALLQ